MQNKIKNKINKELARSLCNLEKTYSLRKASPLLSKAIKELVLGKGKRLRPALFIIGYLGFAKTPAAGLYKTAVSFELLHDFFLVHDDIVDKADKRRGKPAMHKSFDNYLKNASSAKFNGQDLAIIAGDVLYALAIESFLSIKEDAKLKQKALQNFLKAAISTTTGEFIELLSGLKGIEKISSEDIYKIYDYKTARYTFASPLSCGAILGGANKKEIDRLYRYGIYLGRAFQIKDDVLGMFGEEKETGKPALTDLQEAKKTILLWHAYNNSGKEYKSAIKKILSKDKIDRSDLLKMREIISASGTLDFAGDEIIHFTRKAKTIIKSLKMHPRYKELLGSYSRQLLTL
ncbi:MAG: polyprenyl synthetase family protein [Candidatus Omnitrophota bacterium]|nr:MAG: polyprenyl synthetase family protein [Candidatus Omnitrophota bacterium]